MSLLSYTEICELIEQGVIKGADYDCVNSASLDIHLGPTLLLEGNIGFGPENLKYLSKKSQLEHEKLVLPTGGIYAMAPGEFLLAQSREVFNLPNNISAEYKLKSSMARLGLDHLHAGWCDAGWNGSVLTLELKNVTNRHRIVITEGDRIGQLIFYRHSTVPASKSYAARGSYNGDLQTTAVKTTGE